MAAANPSNSAGRRFLNAAILVSALAAFPVVAVACGDGGDETNNFGADTTSASSGDPSGSGDFVDGFGPDQYDPGAGGGSAACEAVDMVFVIDNSPSMAPHQAALAEAFPKFAEQIYKKLPSHVDLHIAITNTSFYDGDCEEHYANCQTLATPEEIEAHYIAPMESSTGRNGEQGRLFEHDQKSFYDVKLGDPDTDGLSEWFAGAAVAAGENGCSFEMPVAAASYAVSKTGNETNKGFVRDEGSVLLYFFLTDEPDKSPEGLAYYKQLILDAKEKCGGSACVRTAGLVPPCVIYNENDNQLSKFLNGFAYPPVLGDITKPEEYEKVVGTALADLVQTACEQVAAPK